MKWVAGIVGALCVLLGGLWLLQGLGLVVMQPILCFANCEPLQGPSVMWTVIGGTVIAVGFAAMVAFPRWHR